MPLFRPGVMGKRRGRCCRLFLISALDRIEECEERTSRELRRAVTNGRRLGRELINALRGG
jgi:hypothetical protein